MALEGVKIVLVPIVDGQEIGQIPLSMVTMRTLAPIISALNEILKTEAVKQGRKGD